jgi:hypothetical protein
MRGYHSHLTIFSVLTFLCILLMVTEEGGRAQTSSATADPFMSGPVPVPADARVTLTSDKSIWFLGENILVQFVVENAGDKPFAISVGGDYRGASRELRYHVKATDASGKPVADPYPSTFNMGGLVGAVTLKPGEKFTRTLPLVRYLRFDGPGNYAISAWHDLGWKETSERRLPVGHMTLTLRMPTPEQARGILDGMERLPEDPSASQGQRSRPFQDFAALRYPVYLPFLVARAQRGSSQVVAGIDGIATPEATRAIIRLLQTSKGKAGGTAAPGVVREAERALVRRLPDPPLSPLEARYRAAQPKEARAESEAATAVHRWFVERAWRPEFAVPARELARRWIGSPQSDLLRSGASVLHSVGTGADLPELLRALDRRLRQTARRPAFPAAEREADHGAWQLQDDCDALLRAGAALRRRTPSQTTKEGGTRLSSRPQAAGEVALFLHLLSTSASRPAGWERRCAGWLDYPVPYVRQLALQALQTPLPAGNTPSAQAPSVLLPAEALRRLPSLLADPDGGVRMTACNLVAQSAQARQQAELRAPVLEIIRTARNSWLLNSANRAAAALGIEYAAWEIWVERLDEKGMTVQALDSLSTVAGRGLSSYRTDGTEETGRVLKPQWKEFLHERRALLEAGGHVDQHDPALLRLFPPDFRYG